MTVHPLPASPVGRVDVPLAPLITGVVSGVRVEGDEDPLMHKIRYLDKLVEELARGKAMDKILRATATS
jgi:hypothetical protein